MARKIKENGSVKISDQDLDGLRMNTNDMTFWNKWCPKGPQAEQVSVYWEAGYYDEPDSFYAVIDWVKV